MKGILTKSAMLFASLVMISACNCRTGKKCCGKDSKECCEVTETKAAPSVKGTYSGVLPAADRDGIRTTLTLKEDMTYELESVYLGEKNETFNENGTYSVSEDGLVALVSSTNEKTYYKSVEGELALSDSTGAVNTGEMAEQYKLKPVK